MPCYALQEAAQAAEGQRILLIAGAAVLQGVRYALVIMAKNADRMLGYLWVCGPASLAAEVEVRNQLKLCLS
jgi:hypothetical protein